MMVKSNVMITMDTELRAILDKKVKNKSAYIENLIRHNLNIGNSIEELQEEANHFKGKFTEKEQQIQDIAKANREVLDAEFKAEQEKENSIKEEKLLREKEDLERWFALWKESKFYSPQIKVDPKDIEDLAGRCFDNNIKLGFYQLSKLKEANLI